MLLQSTVLASCCSGASTSAEMLSSSTHHQLFTLLLAVTSGLVHGWLLCVYSGQSQQKAPHDIHMTPTDLETNPQSSPRRHQNPMVRRASWNFAACPNLVRGGDRSGDALIKRIAIIPVFDSEISEEAAFVRSRSPLRGTRSR